MASARARYASTAGGTVSGSRRARARRDAGAEVETLLAAVGCTTIAGVDEVGRGAWAGPLSVGVAVCSAERLAALPAGIRDSKLLSPVQRVELFGPVAQTLLAYAVGHASPEECDRLGLSAAQRTAAVRAFAELGVEPEGVIVDGSYDFCGHDGAVCVIGGDRISVLVAAASILAKVTRDALMVEAAATHPGYGFERNKGYVSLEHRLAVERLGTSSIHRMTWSVTTGAPQATEGTPTAGVGG